MTVRWPRWAAEAILLAALAFGPLAFGSTEFWSASMLESTLFLLLVLCASGPSRFNLNQPIYKTFLPAVFGVIAIGLLQRLNPRPLSAPATWSAFSVSASSTSRSLLLWAAYAAVLWCAPQVLNSRLALLRFAWTLFLVGGVVAVVGIAQSAQGNAAYYGLRPVRLEAGFPFGPYANRDHAASMLCLSACMGGGLFLSRFSRRQRHAGGLADFIAQQALIGFILAIILFAIFQTGSRGALASMALSAGIVGGAAHHFLKRPGRWLARTALLLTALGYGALMYLSPRWLGIVGGKLDVSIVYRLSMYRGGLALFRDFPVLGIGLGGLAAAFPAYQETLVRGFVDHVHCDWLELLLEVGVVGFALYVVGLACFLFSVVKVWARASSSEIRCIVGGALAAELAFMIHGLADFNLQIPGNAVLFFSIMGFLAGASEAAKRDLAA